MNVRVILVVRTLVVFAMFPALAGCAAGPEALVRGDVPQGDAPSAPVEHEWASPDEAVVRPGILIRTEKRDCVSNFVFIRPDNGAVFIGTTAYCVRDLPLGSAAIVGKETDIAILIYSSWQTMSELGEKDSGAHEYNDFAVFHLDSTPARKTSPALLGIGGPTALADGGALQLGDRVRAFARAPELPSETDWRDGLITGRAGEWALLAHNLPPGSPGTLGGGVIDAEGRAVGVMVNVGVLPNPGANGVARLDRLLSYARDHAGLPVELATAEYNAP